MPKFRWIFFDRPTPGSAADLEAKCDVNDAITKVCQEMSPEMEVVREVTKLQGEFGRNKESILLAVSASQSPYGVTCAQQSDW